MKSLILALLVLAGVAQAPAFDVASIKVNPTKGRQAMTITPTGLDYVSVSLGESLQAAYGVRRFQVAGPDWLFAERFNISARAERAVSADQMRAMLQTLLTERFRLTLHHESKEVAAFALVVGKNGPRLARADPAGERRVELTAGLMTFTNTTMDELADFLSSLPTLGRPVFDETGLTGRFNLALRMNDGQQDATPADTKRAMVAGDPSFVTDALDTIGLKLDAQRRPVDTIVIDRAEKTPIEN
jgi:uncharacterized protein (TIGR03435 family)